jgi:hypothetical protein
LELEKANDSMEYKINCGNAGAGTSLSAVGNCHINL